MDIGRREAEVSGGGLTLKEKRIVARFRCGMEFRGGRYWMTVEDRSCRLCGAEEETVWHVMRGCRLLAERECGYAVGWVLGERGRGLSWMIGVLEMRKNVS